MPYVIAVLAALWWFEVWPFGPAYTYMPEVGYWRGTERAWDVGRRYNNKEECISAATATFNFYNRESSSRAFS